MPTASRIASFKNRALKLETAESVKELFDGLDLGKVEKLVMSGNTLGVEAGRELGRFIEQMPNLQVANLSNIFTTRSIDEIPGALTPICSALSLCTKLREVDISDNAFGQRSVDAVAPLLVDGPPLEVLKLANIGMNVEGGRMLAQMLVDAGKKRSAAGGEARLATLVLSRNLLGDGSAGAWAEVIKVHPTLRRFESNRNDFREDGIIAIAQGLLGCKGLERLTIEDAVVGNAANDGKDEVVRGWKVLADVIRASPGLEVLHLPSCSFRDEGLDELLNVLNDQTFPRLKSIRLEHNELAEDHFAALLSAVRTSLPKLGFLRVTVDDDTEDSERVREIGRIIESRGGKFVVLHENDFSDEEEELEGSDEEEEEREEVKEEIDELADIVSKLNVQ